MFTVAEHIRRRLAEWEPTFPGTRYIPGWGPVARVSRGGGTR